jgi:hypothetical protein
MIFAEMEYDQHYSEIHFPLVDVVSLKFPNIEHGLQGDSWIWIFEGGEKVAIDTFSSMKHQVKSDTPNGSLAKKVIELLSTKFKLNEYHNPQLEPHEDG